MKYSIERANERGHANHGWLKSNFSFSFSQYYNPEKIHFGLLRVVNDDDIAPGTGFGTHPHENMKIVTIPLSGALEHRDSMGHTSVIQSGEVQIMSAGSGITHSEYNHSKTEPLHLFQIWVFPREKNLQPRYDQKLFSEDDRKNKLQTLVSPDKVNGSLLIHQDAWFSRLDLTKGNSSSYSLNQKGHGLFLLVIEGEIEIAGEKLYTRDSIKIEDTEVVTVQAVNDAELLLIEVPMN